MTMPAETPEGARPEVPSAAEPAPAEAPAPTEPAPAPDENGVDYDNEPVEEEEDLPVPDVNPTEQPEHTPQSAEESTMEATTTWDQYY